MVIRLLEFMTCEYCEVSGYFSNQNCNHCNTAGTPPLSHLEFQPYATEFRQKQITLKTKFVGFGIQSQTLLLPN